MKTKVDNLLAFSGIFFSINLELNFRKGQANYLGKAHFCDLIELPKNHKNSGFAGRRLI
jgi:hypothetical protein